MYRKRRVGGEFCRLQERGNPGSGKSSLKITLKEDSKALEEVVVIGYGSARKSDDRIYCIGRRREAA